MNNLSQRALQLQEDLAVLAEVLSPSGPLKPSAVRVVAAATVRKWLLDGNINLLSQEWGKRLELPAYDTGLVQQAINQGTDVNFFLAGGVLMGGRPIRWMYASKSDFTGVAPIPVDAKVALYTPGKFLASKRLYFDGEWFSMEQILRFVANKAGGVHLDYSRDTKQVKLELAAQYMTFGNPNFESETRVVDLAEPGGPCLVVVPPERGNVWSAIEIELLSAVQSLVSIRADGAFVLEAR